MRPPQDPVPVAVGQVLAGKYRVERVLGVGGMGVVVAAMHTLLGERVALKFLLPRLAEDATIVARFSREAQAAARIKGEHVARVTDVGSLDDGIPYLVMELLEGEDLAQRVKRLGRLPVAEAVGYVGQACVALAEAHRHGIVHRDLKPANLFLSTRADGSPLVKVLDFGISKAVDGTEDASMTQTSTSLGSPYYMSPEQIRNAKGVDPRADVWALGVILHELVTGRPPFVADTAPALYAAILTDDMTPMAALAPGVPPGFEHVVATCLAKKPAARFPDVGSLVSALVPYGPPGFAAVAESVVRVHARSHADAPSSVRALGVPPPSSQPSQPRTGSISSPDGPASIAMLSARSMSRSSPGSLPGSQTGGRTPAPAPNLTPTTGASLPVVPPQLAASDAGVVSTGGARKPRGVAPLAAALASLVGVACAVVAALLLTRRAAPAAEAPREDPARVVASPAASTVPSAVAPVLERAVEPVAASASASASASAPAPMSTTVAKKPVTTTTTGAPAKSSSKYSGSRR